MSSLEKKRKTTTTTTKKLSPSSSQSNTTPLLPDDLLLSCFARVSRLYYRTLSLVFKRFRSLLASPELYKARSLLGNTENCIYLCLGSYRRTLWYTLCLKPNQTLTNDSNDQKKKSSGYVFARVPIPRSPRSYFWSLVAVGSNIYNIEVHSSRVSVLDCHSHTWCEAPSLPVKLASLSASVLDGKIYVAGSSYKDGNSGSLKNTFQVFDTKTQIWDPETIPCSETQCNLFNSRSACIDGKFHVNTNKAVAYDSKKGRWDLVVLKMGDYMINSYCVIENVLYSASHGVLRWYDSEVSMWRYLKGLGRLPKFPHDASVRLADYGGKMAVLWEGDLFDLGHGGSYKKIWYAEIELERRNGPEIWGKVEWSDNVLTVPKSYRLVKVLVVTV